MARAAREETREIEGRRQRVPLGTPAQRLQAPKRKSFVRRWINDVPGRIGQAITGGYAHVLERPDEDGSAEKRSAIVGSNQDGSPLTAYLMEIPEELYKQDQQAKQREIDKVDAAIKRGNIRGADPEDSGNYYVPSEGISVRTD